MIYELAVSTKSEAGDGMMTKVEEVVVSVVKNHKGEVLISDDWGYLNLPQEMKRRVKTVRMLYFLYSADSESNKELSRRLKLTEGLLRHMIVLLGDDSKATGIVKNLKVPFSKKYPGSVMDSDESEEEDDRDRKKFSRKRGCYFVAKNIKADWKDPKTYSWLVNEFGKISPARVSNISRKHQRFVTQAVKRARNMGFIGHLSSHVARSL